MKKLILTALLLIAGLSPVAMATVQNTTNTVQYSGDGVSTTFTFNNNVYATTDLIVYEITSSGTTTLTLNVNYTVTLAAISGTTGAYTATINLAGGSNPSGVLPIGTTLAIVRSIPFTQLINISDYSQTPAATWNQALDRGSILSQQLLNYINRSVLQPVTATTSLSFPTGVANYNLCWDATGTTLVNCVGTPTGNLGVPIANSNLQTLTQANLVNGSSLFGSGTMSSFATTGNVGIGTPAPSTGRLVVSGGNVGIGTGIPGGLLDVKGTINDFQIITNGNVGIGTVLPGMPLDVNGTIRATSLSVNGFKGILGAWTSPSPDANTYCGTDLILFYGGTTSTGCVQCLTDSSATPSTQRDVQCGVGTSTSLSVSCVCKKGDYYNVGKSGSVSSEITYAIPSGN